MRVLSMDARATPSPTTQSLAAPPRRRPLWLAAFFIGAGVNHFVVPRSYERIVPPRYQHEAARLVRWSGVAEVAGGVGVLLPWTRRAAGIGLIALLAAVFPANLYMARAPERFARIPRWALYARLPLQPLMMWWAWRTTQPLKGVARERGFDAAMFD
jgi:uncharacterized membrane protein